METDQPAQAYRCPDEGDDTCKQFDKDDLRRQLAATDTLTKEVQRAIDYLTYMGKPIPEGSAPWETRACAVLVAALRNFDAIKDPEA